jgi:hypothetical protein
MERSLRSREANADVEDWKSREDLPNETMEDEVDMDKRVVLRLLEFKVAASEEMEETEDLKDKEASVSIESREFPSLG